MAILPVAAKSLSEYTSKGYKLLSKVYSANGEFYKSAPKNIPYSCIIKVAGDFGKTEKNISLYFSANGKIWGSKIIQILSDKDKVLSRTFKEFDWRKDNNLCIKTYKYLSEKMIEDTDDLMFLSPEKNLFSRVKLILKNISENKREEQQIYEEISKKGKKFIKTKGIRLMPSWKMTDTQVLSNFADVDKLKQDPYLFSRNLSPKEFAQSVFPIIKKLQHISKKVSSQIQFKNLQGCAGTFYPVSKNILINLNENLNNTEIVDTIAHETRHLHQDIRADKYFKSLFNFILPKKAKIKLSATEKKQSKKFFLANFSYILSLLNKKFYQNNPLEIDAFKAGHKFARSYQAHSKYLASLFENIPQSAFKFLDKFGKNVEKNMQSGNYNIVKLN